MHLVCSCVSPQRVQVGYLDAKPARLGSGDRATEISNIAHICVTNSQNTIAALAIGWSYAPNFARALGVLLGYYQGVKHEPRGRWLVLRDDIPPVLLCGRADPYREKPVVLALWEAARDAANAAHAAWEAPVEEGKEIEWQAARDRANNALHKALGALDDNRVRRAAGLE